MRKWLLGAVMFGICALVRADELGSDRFLLGDWAGLRTRLHERGVDFLLHYFSEPAYNLSGGDKRLLRYADQFTADATFDLDKLFSWPRAIFKITLTYRNGSSLSAEANLHTLMEVQEVYGRGDILRLTELSYEQVLLDV